MMPTLKWTRATASYDENESNSTIDNYRNQKVSDWTSNNLSGTLVLGEGEVWIDLIGDEDDVDNEIHNMAGDNFLSNMNVRTTDSVGTGQFTEVYTYHEERNPITSV